MGRKLDRSIVIPISVATVFSFFHFLASFSKSEKVQFSIFSFLILSLIVAWLFSLCGAAKKPWNIEKHDVIPMLGILLLGTLSRIYKLSDKTLWYLENNDVGVIFNYHVNGALNGDDLFYIVQSASWAKHQPPLSFLFEAFGIFLFGLNEVGIRAHSVFFGVLSLIAIYILIKNITKSRLLSTFGSLLAILHPLLVYYSQEGRPYSTAVFFTVLYLIAIVDVKKNYNKNNLIFLFSSQTLYLFSIGMQPPVVIVLMTLLFPMFFPEKNLFKKIFLITICSFVIYTPYLINLFNISREQGYIKNIVHDFDYFIVNIWRAYQDMMAPYTEYFLFLCVFSFVIIFFTKKNKIFSSSQHFCDRFLILLFLFIFLFICTICSAHLFMDHYMNKRRLLLGVPIFIVTLTLSLYRVGSFRWRKQGLITIFSLFIFLIPLQKNIITLPQVYGIKDQNIIVQSRRYNWKNLYHYIKKESSPRDVVFLYHMNDPSTRLELHEIYMPYRGKKYAQVSLSHKLDDLEMKERVEFEYLFILLWGLEREKDSLLKKGLSMREGVLIDYREISSSPRTVAIKLKVNKKIEEILGAFIKNLQQFKKNSEV